MVVAFRGHNRVMNATLAIPANVGVMLCRSFGLEKVSSQSPLQAESYFLCDEFLASNKCFDREIF